MNFEVLFVMYNQSLKHLKSSLQNYSFLPKD